MHKIKFTKLLSVILCVVLIAAVSLITTGCSTSNEKTDFVDSVNTDTTDTEEINSAAGELGEGDKSFIFKVVDAEGNENSYLINTDATTVGEALMELDLIAGDEGDFGLYVKTVDGITLDYDTDGKYWAFYIGGKYAMTGVDSTDITEGVVYSFAAE